MLKTWFNEWKYIILLSLLVVYSVGIWNVSYKVHDVEVARDRLRQAERVIEIQNQNEALLTTITEQLRATEARLKEQAKKDQKDLLDELAKDPRYRTCTVTDGVRDLYKRKLQSQR